MLVCVGAISFRKMPVVPGKLRATVKIRAATPRYQLYLGLRNARIFCGGIPQVLEGSKLRALIRRKSERYVEIRVRDGERSLSGPQAKRGGKPSSRYSPKADFHRRYAFFTPERSGKRGGAVSKISRGCNGDFLAMRGPDGRVARWPRPPQQFEAVDKLTAPTRAPVNPSGESKTWQLKARSFLKKGAFRRGRSPAALIQEDFQRAITHWPGAVGASEIQQRRTGILILGNQGPPSSILADAVRGRVRRIP